MPVNNCPVGHFGAGCSASDSICDLSKPCSNNGTCLSNSTNDRGFTCSCAPYFNGSNCQNDYRPCTLLLLCLGKGKKLF